MTSTTLFADKAPASVPASTLKSTPRVEPLTCAIGAEVSNVDLGSASRDPDLMAEVGFRNVRYRRVGLGSIAIHVGRV